MSCEWCFGRGFIAYAIPTRPPQWQRKPCTHCTGETHAAKTRTSRPLPNTPAMRWFEKHGMPKPPFVACHENVRTKAESDELRNWIVKVLTGPPCVMDVVARRLVDDIYRKFGTVDNDGEEDFVP